MLLRKYNLILTSLLLVISLLIPFNNYTMNQNQMSIEEMERFQEEFLKLSPQEQEERLMEEFNKLSPEEQKQVIEMQTQIFETISALEKEVGKERLESMSEDELLQLLDSKFGTPTQQPVPTEEVPAATPTTTEPIIPTNPLAELKPILNNIVQRTESLLLKANNIPELPGKIESWVQKGTINTWNNIQEYTALRYHIEKFNAYLRTLLTAEGESWYGTYIKNNATVKNILIELEKVLIISEPLIDINTFGMKKIGDTSKKSLIAVINAYGNALNNQKILDTILTAVAQYEPEAKKLRDLKAELQKKAESSIHIGAPKNRIEVGSAHSRTRGNKKNEYNDYSTRGNYSGGNSYSSRNNDYYNMGNDDKYAPYPKSTSKNNNVPTKKTGDTHNKKTSELKNPKENEKKSTLEKKNDEKIDEASKRVEVMIKLCQELATFDKEIPFTILQDKWFTSNTPLTEPDKNFVKTTLPKLIRHLRQNIAEEIKTLKVILRKHSKAKEYQAKIQNIFKDSSKNIVKVNSSLCLLEKEYAQFSSQFGPYAYSFLHLGQPSGKDSIKGDKSLYDLQAEYVAIEDLMRDMVVMISTQ